MPARLAQQDDVNIQRPPSSGPPLSDHLLPPAGEKASGNSLPSPRVRGERVVRQQTDRVRGDLDTPATIVMRSADFLGSIYYGSWAS
jgi:hypothetical protein